MDESPRVVDIEVVTSGPEPQQMWPTTTPLAGAADSALAGLTRLVWVIQSARAWPSATAETRATQRQWRRSRRPPGVRRRARRSDTLGARCRARGAARPPGLTTHRPFRGRGLGNLGAAGRGPRMPLRVPRTRQAGRAGRVRPAPRRAMPACSPDLRAGRDLRRPPAHGRESHNDFRARPPGVTRRVVAGPLPPIVSDMAVDVFIQIW
jgi:hypothetical protein